MQRLLHLLSGEKVDKTFFGHPIGLRTLFFTEMWERFSYYGMRAILILYAVASDGLNLPVATAALIYGLYTMSVYLFSLPGGYISDRFLGAKRSVLWGGILIALGHFTIAFSTLLFFFLGLGLIVLGTSLLKPSISALVGNLYANQESKRDSGFSLFYMGINLGAFFAPFVCGYLGQFVAWHYGFGAAGIGMVLGLIQYIRGQKYLTSVSDHTSTFKASFSRMALTSQDWARIFIIGLLFTFSAIFWMAFEQAGSSLNLFADNFVRNEIFGFSFPSSWLQAVNPIFIIIMAPIFSWIWMALGKNQPGSSTKFSVGLLFAAMGFYLLAFASQFVGEGKVSFMWLIGVYFLHTCGELCVSPVGLSMVTRLAPTQLVAFFLGVWFVSLALGNYLGGWVASHFNVDPDNLVHLFNSVGYVCLTAAIVLMILYPVFRRLERKGGGA